MFKLTTVQKLDLSDNSLTELPKDVDFFEKMTSLQFLFLEDNLIDWPDSVMGLKGAPSLKYLSLRGNPVEQAPDLTYRYDMVRLIPGLSALDSHVVSFDE